MKNILILTMILFPLMGISQCFISFVSTTAGGSNASGQYAIQFEVQFTNAPTTGNLVFQINDGISTYDTLIPAPFSSPTFGSLSFMAANGNSCAPTAFFSDEPTCTITSGTYNAPMFFPCIVDGGTHSELITGNSILNGVLTWGDQLSLTTNGDYVHHDSVSTLNVDHDPGFGYLLYTCPPDELQRPDPFDPCLVGIIGFGDSFQDENVMGSIYNSVPQAAITNNTIYIAAFPFYSMVDNIYSWSVGTQDWCYDWGDVFPITYLDSIAMDSISDPVNGSVDFTISGGYPALNGSNFTISDVLPVSANISQTVISNNGSFTLSSLENGDNYSFVITDDAGSIRYVNHGYLNVVRAELENISLAPNPFGSHIDLSNVPDGTAISMYDSKGSLLKKYSNQHLSFIETSELQSGVYFLHFELNGLMSLRKIVK